MKIREIFEYEVDTDKFENIFTIQNYVDCVDGMTCPFWDGMIHPEITSHELMTLE